MSDGDKLDAILDGIEIDGCDIPTIVDCVGETGERPAADTAAAADKKPAESCGDH